jgi:flagellar hook-associated protein 3 FlgL
MRVTFNALHREASAGLERANERMLEWQRQVSTGRRIGKPSDDPSATAAAIVERAQRAGVEQYTQTADSVGSRLQVTDVVLADMLDKLTAAQAVALGARGSSVSQSQRDAVAAELEGLRDAVLEDLNTTFGGTYLFGGAAATVPPYSKDGAGVVSGYAGSTATVEVEIAREHRVTIAYNGEAIARGTAADDVFVVFARTIDAARSGNDDELATGIQELNAAFNRVVGWQSRVGAAMQSVDDEKVRLGQAERSIDAHLSTLEDANMAEAITGMTQAEAAYRAALAAAAAVNRASLMDYLK